VKDIPHSAVKPSSLFDFLPQPPIKVNPSFHQPSPASSTFKHTLIEEDPIKEQPDYYSSSFTSP